MVHIKWPVQVDPLHVSANFGRIDSEITPFCSDKHFGFIKLCECLTFSLQRKSESQLDQCFSLNCRYTYAYRSVVYNRVIFMKHQQNSLSFRA